MEKIKIVFVLGTLDIGGTETQFLQLIRDINRQRFDLRVLAFPCSGKLREELEALHVPFTCLNFTGLAGKYRLTSYRQLYRLFRDMIGYFHRERPHIVQSFLFWANVYGTLAAKMARVPVILTGRRGVGDKYQWKWHYRWLQNLSNLLATEAVANSNVVRQHCLRSERFLKADQITVIHNGIDVEQYHPSVETGERLKYDMCANAEAVIGIVANLHECKGHQTFLKAAARVLRTHPKTTFVLVGRDEGMRSVLEAQVKALEIEDAVVFTGERHDIPALLTTFDIHVSASSTEGLSNAILEGMACGIPVIATAVGGNPELVIDQETGILVPPGAADALVQAMIRLLDAPELRRQMGKKGRQRVITHFSTEQLIQHAETLYQRVAHIEKMTTV